MYAFELMLKLTMLTCRHLDLRLRPHGATRETTRCFLENLAGLNTKAHGPRGGFCGGISATPGVWRTLTISTVIYKLRCGASKLSYVRGWGVAVLLPRSLCEACVVLRFWAVWFCVFGCVVLLCGLCGLCGVCGLAVWPVRPVWFWL